MTVFWRLFYWLVLFATGWPVYAWTWHDLWKTPDQQAQEMMDARQYQEAAGRFQRQDWRATAAYRAGAYQQAARAYLQLHTVDGDYNAGNALAKLGQYSSAIAAYDKALAKDPNHADARYNRTLVQALLEQSKQKKQQDKSQNQSPSQQNQQQEKSKSNQSQKSAQASQSKGSQPKASESKPSEKETPDSKTKTPTPAQSDPKSDESKSKKQSLTRAQREQQEAKEQWLRLIPDDPGGLLREKFLRDHLNRSNEY